MPWKETCTMNEKERFIHAGPDPASIRASNANDLDGLRGPTFRLGRAAGGAAMTGDWEDRNKKMPVAVDLV